MSEVAGERPDFSIVMPCFNERGMVSEAIESCLSQLGDSTLEVIVVDDGSTDGTFDFLRSRFSEAAKVKIHRQSNAGPGAARNLGVKNALGDHILFLDADDLIGPEFLKTVKAAIDGCSVGGGFMVLSPFSYFQTEKTRSRSWMQFFRAPRMSRKFRAYNRFCLLTGNCFPISSCVMRRQFFLDSGGFDESLRHHEDWDLWIRMVARAEEILYTDAGLEAATLIRMRDGLMSDGRAMRDSMKKVVQRHAAGGWAVILKFGIGWGLARSIRFSMLMAGALIGSRSQHLKGPLARGR